MPDKNTPLHAWKSKSAQFRFYEELNDFLSREKRKRPFLHSFHGKPSLKDVIESLGVPHTEVDLILVNGESVGFSRHLQSGDSVSVYPVFESMDISGLTRLCGRPLRKPRFILDVHLGKLAKWLRLFGFDAFYSNSYGDAEIVKQALEEKRVILTRDRGILKRGVVTHGYWIRSADPKAQVKEILKRFDLHSMAKPFKRCLTCNGDITPVTPESVGDSIPEGVRNRCTRFFLCQACHKVFWEGSHYDRMKRFVDETLRNSC